MGAVGVEDGFVAGVGLQKATCRHVAFGRVQRLGEGRQVGEHRRLFFGQLLEVQLQEATVTFEERLRRR